MTREADRAQLNRLGWASWVPWMVAVAGLLYLVGLTVWLAVSGLLFPYQLDYGEGVMLHFVNQWAQGQPIYTPIGDYPLVTSNYAPLTILVALALTPLLGVTYAAGRVWTLLAIGAVAGIIVAWVRRERGRWLPAVAAALLFVGSPYVYHWAPLFRVDLVGLALSLGGLYAVWRGVPTPHLSRRQGERSWWLWIAIVLFVAALYAKQSFIFAPAAAALYLFFLVDRREAIKLVAGVGLLGGGLFLVINALTGGGFWEGLVASNVNPFLWPEYQQQLADFFGTFAVLALLTLWYLVDKFVREHTKPLQEKVSLLDLYLVAALVSLGLAGKAGAWENYFFEALVALALCSGLGLARLDRYGPWAYRLLAPLLVLAQVGLMWHTPGIAEGYIRLTRESNEAMAPILAQTGDPIISEDMGLLVTSGKTMDYYSFQYSQLARAGRWDQAWELDQLRNRRLSTVILETGTRLDVDRYQRFTREFLSELDRNYRRSRTVGKYELYEPDPLQHEGLVEFGDQLALVGWGLHAPPEIDPGTTISLTAVWQAQQPLTTHYTAFAHLVDEEGQGWAGDDHVPYDGLYPTSAWGAGEMVRDTFQLTVPPDAPPGLYDLLVGWYPSAPPLDSDEPQAQERLPVGEGDSFRLAVVPVSWSGMGSQSMTPIGAQFSTSSGAAVVLEGYALQSNPEAVQVTLRWSSAGPLDTDYTVFVHMVAPDNPGEVLSQGDALPLGGRWPTSLWLPGVALDDPHTLPLPDDLAPGAYAILVGWYDPITGERLRLPDGDDALLLTEVEQH